MFTDPDPKMAASGAREDIKEDMGQYDDIPKEDPPGYYDGADMTKMIIVKAKQFVGPSKHETFSIAVSARGTYVAVTLIPRLGRDHTGETKSYRVDTGQEMILKGFSSISTAPSMYSGSGMVFGPPSDEAALLCSHTWVDMNSVGHSHLNLYDLNTRRKRQNIEGITMTAPLAWSPDGSLVAGRKETDHTKVMMSNTAVVPGNPRTPAVAPWSIRGVIPSHMEKITHTAFTPDSSGIVTMSKDGWIRLSSAVTGKTMGKVRIETRYKPSLMTVATDGASVVTVWGRDVRIWSFDKGEVLAYDLDDVREEEGWPICISPDGKLLVCRTESGFDISDLATGGFLAEIRGESSFVTCGAFAPDGRSLFLGKWSGALDSYNIVA